MSRQFYGSRVARIWEPFKMENGVWLTRNLLGNSFANDAAAVDDTAAAIQMMNRF